MAVMGIGWLNLFGGPTGARQISAASVLDGDRAVSCGALLALVNRWRLSSFAVDVCSPRPDARRGGTRLLLSREKVTIAVAAGQDILWQADGSRRKQSAGAWCTNLLGDVPRLQLPGRLSGRGGFDRIFAERCTTGMGCGRHPYDARMGESHDTSQPISWDRCCVLHAILVYAHFGIKDTMSFFVHVFIDAILAMTVFFGFAICAVADADAASLIGWVGLTVRFNQPSGTRPSRSRSGWRTPRPLPPLPISCS